MFVAESVAVTRAVNVVEAAGGKQEILVPVTKKLGTN